MVPLPRVLVVDNDLGMRETLQVILRSVAEIILVGSGEEALVVQQTTPADVVLLDLRLPGQSGLEVLPVLKASSDCEIIIISAIEDLEVIVLAMRLGAFHYLVKDFDRDVVQHLVLQAYRAVRLQRRLQQITSHACDDLERTWTHLQAASRAINQCSQAVLNARASLRRPLQAIRSGPLDH